MFLFEALLLALAIAQADVFMLGVDQRALRVVLVGAEIVKKLLIDAVAHHMALVLDVLVVDLRDPERVWLGIFVVATQNTAAHHVLVQNTREAHPHHVVALRDLKRDRATCKRCFEQAALDTLAASHEFVNR
jgi:hypothetical protein